MMKSNYILTENGNLHVITAGSTGKAVLLLGGAGLDNAHLSWKHLIPVLAKSHRVFALDWPKQGQSTPWKGVADHERLLECVDTVLTHFGLDTIILVGLSQGGAITLAYTLSRPGKVEKFVAIAPAGVIRFPPVLHQMLWLSAKMTWLTNGISRFCFHNRKTAKRSLKVLFPILPNDFESIVDDIMLEAERNGVKASDWQNNSIGFLKMNVYLVPELHKITCPCLFIQGSKDVAVNPKQVSEAVKRTPSAKLVMLENTGHWPNRQSPEKVNAVILDFLNVNITNI